MPDEYSRSYLRLRPDIISVKTAEGVVVYSKSGAILINGPDTNAIFDTIFPLLDGTRTLSEVFEIVPKIEPAHLSHILEELRDHDILEERRQRSSAIPSEDEFRLLLEKAWVDISGDELYATLCAEAIKNAGIGRVTVEQLAEGNVPDMALGVFHGGDKTILRSFAESANRMQIPSINCAIHEDEVIVGPLTIPGRSACWNCSDLRIEANVTWNDPHPHAAGRTRELDTMIGELIARQVCEAVCWGYAQSRLVDHVIILNRLSLSTSRHRILGVPGCKVCDGPIAFKRSELNEEYHVSDLPKDELVLSALSWFVDSRTGIVNRVVVEKSTDTGLDLPIIATAIPAETPGGLTSQGLMPVGWGKGITSTEAVMGALGEAIERYSASMPDPVRINWSRLADLHGDVLDPRMFALYGENQYRRPDFPYVRFDASINHPWIAGKWAGTQDPVWVPAILTYLSLVVRQENVFCQGTSNGLAAGTHPEEAALRAILELLERDTFLTSWRLKRPGRHVRLDRGLAPELMAVLNGISILGGKVELVLLESICGYSTAVCLAFGDGTNWPGVTLGLATDPDAHVAVRQAILEQGQTGPYLRRLMKTTSGAIPVCAQDVKKMLDHAIYYFPPERASAFDYLRDSCSATPLPDPGSMLDRSLSACSQALAKLGIRVALVDVTSSDIAMSPFHVIRAVSPDLQPISFGYGLDRLSVPHLATLTVASNEDDIVPIW